MSSETFLRLPEEKRKRFLDAAWEEFSSTRFEEASINQIVKRAKIPRGSFYQYFLSKDDLFAYLLEDVRVHVQEEYRKILKENGGDLFQAQLTAFDRMDSNNMALDPVMHRCMQFIRKNQAIDILKLLHTRPGYRLMDGLWDLMDLTPFRRKDKQYIFNVWALLMAALGSACMDALCGCPEDRAVCREDLVMRLEIVRGGCQAAR